MWVLWSRISLVASPWEFYEYRDGAEGMSICLLIGGFLPECRLSGRAGHYLPKSPVESHDHPNLGLKGFSVENGKPGDTE